MSLYNIVKDTQTLSFLAHLIQTLSNASSNLMSNIMFSKYNDTLRRLLLVNTKRRFRAS